MTASRADFGLLMPLIRALRDDADIRLTLYATGMHFSRRHGETINEIREHGFGPVLVEVPAAPDTDSPAAMGAAMASAVAGFSRCFAAERPDLLVVMGDRLDVLTAVVAALPFEVPVAHISGGELSQGVVDDRIRHAITKMSHLHFVAHRDYADRVIQMGEEPWRVTISGEPGLDMLFDGAGDARPAGRADLDLPDGRPVTAFTFHPEGADRETSRRQIETILRAAAEIDSRIVFTYPNADPGSQPIIEAIEAFCAARPDCSAHPSLGRMRYLDLLRRADCMAGNSSSGIVEAASFRLPVVNIGERQTGRIAPANVISVPIEEDAIAAAWRRALSEPFRRGLKGLVNPYGDGKATGRIMERIKSVALDRRLVVKPFHDPGAGCAEDRAAG